MAQVCHLLALESGMPDDETAVLMHAAPMHDVGKIATPDAVLLKPGRLTPEEWDIMKLHPTIGLQILDGSQRPILKAAAVIAHQHHEKWDGSGYPQGLKGEDIHPYARIVAVADVFDALTHERVYKKAWPIDQVRDYLHEVAGQHLDPHYVDILIRNIDKAAEINERWPD
jgi:response regulator RpfG family c-di-GMP phosphodiesterase